jgi:hypothetical protein
LKIKTRFKLSQEPAIDNKRKKCVQKFPGDSNYFGTSVPLLELFMEQMVHA